MSRPRLIVVVACAAVAVGCSALASVIGVPKIVAVTISAPAGLLVGESAIATAVAMGDDGRDHGGRTRNWSSSDPAALPIDASGKMTALIAGRTVTITCEVDGTKGTATVVTAGDDSRFGYALADQPTAAAPYAPDAATRFTSSGGAITVTRNGTGLYTVRFAGLGRAPGQRDNVQVSGYNATAAAYCKPNVWVASGADLVVDVACFAPPTGTPIDSRFTILAIGARALGQTATLGFLLYRVTPGTTILDSAATSHNSSGGQVVVGNNSVGNYSINLTGLGKATPGPIAVEVTTVGQDANRCRNQSIDLNIPGFNVLCTAASGSSAESSFSLLMLQRGRPSQRIGYGYSTNDASATNFATDAPYSYNSSGGTIVSRRLAAAGQYRVTFAGLGKSAGATETVLVSPFLFADRVCDVISWGNSGTNDLIVDVACYDATGAPASARFNVLVIQ